MQTYNASVYHCVSCGRVVHAELKTAPPQCCGHTMAEVIETIHEGDAAGKEACGCSENEKLQGQLDARLKELDVEIADLREQGAERENEAATK